MKQTTSAHSVNMNQEAVNRSQSAGRSALAARNARDEAKKIHLTLEDWAKIFANSPIMILTLLFGFSVLMEIAYSWPMYSDIMSQMTGAAHPVLSLVCSLFIVFWGGYISHLVAKRLSHSMFEYTIHNHMKSSEHPIPHAAAREKASHARHRDFVKGIILGIVLIGVVAAISWQRVWLMGAINGTDYSMTHKLLPVICVLVEIISGVYIGYLYRRYKLVLKSKMLQREYRRQKHHCAYETMMAHEHYRHASNAHEPIHYSKDLRGSLYRYEHRSQDSENYVDEIPPLKTLKVVVADEKGLASGVHLAAVLSDGAYCNSIQTNHLGEGVLTWEGEAKEVTTLYTDNIQHKGPFRENSTIRIDLKNGSH